MVEAPKYTTLIEQVEYKNIYPKELTNQLIEKGLCKLRDDKIKFTATGILIYKNSFIIVFPKAYRIPNEEKTLMEHIQVLFKVLLRYKLEAELAPEEMDLLGGENGEFNENLLTSVGIIQDFTQNGLLVKEMKVKSATVSGHIDWSSTINTKQPIISGDSVVYTDPVTRKTTVDRQHKLLLLHKYCVYKSLVKYGWLFDLSANNVGLEVADLSINLSSEIHFLNRELNSTFNEREISVIKMLKDFLIGINHNNIEDKVETLVTPYFHNVWELICSVNFKNQYKNLKQIVPKLKWEIDSSAPIMPQRPDILMLKGTTLYILDAKYYNTNINLPGWHDVVKQLFYSFTILKNIKSKSFSLHDKKLEKKVKGIEKIENVFLFPSEESDSIKYVGKVNVERNEDLKDIRAYKLNTFFAMKCYLGKDKFDYFYSLENSTTDLS